VDFHFIFPIKFIRYLIVNLLIFIVYFIEFIFVMIMGFIEMLLNWIIKSRFYYSLI